MLPKLICMCGLQGSGKSTKAKELKEQLEKEYLNQKTIILSSDQIRKEHPEIAQDNNKVFSKLYSDMNYWLRQGDNVIIDATNITNKARNQIFHNLKEDCHKICYIMNTPYEECKFRLNKRNAEENSHKVPLEALEMYYHSFEIPFFYEGFNEIKLDKQITLAESNIFLQNISMQARGFNQQNKHHTQDLGEHMDFVGNTLVNLTNNILLIQAGYVHDVGKLYTQTRGEDGNCHYYNHENVGAYNLMCYTAYYDIFGKYDLNKTLRWLFYINYHMELHQVVTEKSVNKWKRIFGEDLYNDLKLFEEVDKSRPDTV